MDCHCAREPRSLEPAGRAPRRRGAASAPAAPRPRAGSASRVLARPARRLPRASAPAALAPTAPPPLEADRWRGGAARPAASIADPSSWRAPSRRCARHALHARELGRPRRCSTTRRRSRSCVSPGSAPASSACAALRRRRPARCAERRLRRDRVADRGGRGDPVRPLDSGSRSPSASSGPSCSCPIVSPAAVAGVQRAVLAHELWHVGGATGRGC